VLTEESDDPRITGSVDETDGRETRDERRERYERGKEMREETRRKDKPKTDLPPSARLNDTNRV
jgi:hypothetical protein